jgi:hypothetical protein
MEKNYSQKIIVQLSLSQIKKTPSIKSRVTRYFHPTKPYSGANYIFLVKHHQNFIAELLHHKILEQSISEVEGCHAKHALNVPWPRDPLMSWIRLLGINPGSTMVVL